MTDREAILGSIEHWKENLDNCILFELDKKGVIDNIENAIDLSYRSCALCFEYFPECEDGCPIYNKVNVPGCESTPYLKVKECYDAILYSEEWNENLISNLQEAIEEELTFLYELLEGYSD